jgi:hypothetical protein
MPTYSTTTKYLLRALLGGNLVADIDTGFASLASDIDANMAGYAEGTFAGKPAAAKAGRIYRCTDTGQWLADTGTTWIDLNAAPQLLSSLPSSPYDGQEIYYSADPTNGVIWHLRYRSASAPPYKWELVGGPPLTAEVATFESTSSAFPVDLATVGPSITIPLAGDYVFEMSTRAQSGATVGALAGLKIGASTPTATGPDVMRLIVQGVYSIDGHIARSLRRNVASASTVCKMVYGWWATSGSVGYDNRVLLARPVRVG